MGMGMKSLKWEGIGTKNLFPHTSSVECWPMPLCSCKHAYRHTVGYPWMEPITYSRDPRVGMFLLLNLYL